MNRTYSPFSSSSIPAVHHPVTPLLHADTEALPAGVLLLPAPCEGEQGLVLGLAGASLGVVVHCPEVGAEGQPYQASLGGGPGVVPLPAEPSGHPEGGGVVIQDLGVVIAHPYQLPFHTP